MSSELPRFGEIREAGPEMRERPPFVPPTDQSAVSTDDSKRKVLQIDTVDPRNDTQFKSKNIFADEISSIGAYNQDAPVGSKIGELQTFIAMDRGHSHITPHDIHQIAQHLPVTNLDAPATARADLDAAQKDLLQRPSLRFLQMRIIEGENEQQRIINAGQIAKVEPYKAGDGPTGSKIFDVTSAISMKSGQRFLTPYASEQITSYMPRPAPVAAVAEPIIVRESLRRPRIAGPLSENTKA